MTMTAAAAAACTATEVCAHIEALAECLDFTGSPEAGRRNAALHVAIAVLGEELAAATEAEADIEIAVAERAAYGRPERYL